MEYVFLQKYWWMLISLLASILVFLLFVQGGNSLIFRVGKTEEQRSLMVNSTGRKWELTFTTLVVFGGAFFASFPLFYSTSFGGAYWLWMIILFTFVLQAVSFEFQSRLGNFLGKNTYRYFLVFNGIVAPFLIGCMVGSFFTGSSFIVNKMNIADKSMPIISSWANGWHGIDILFNPWNLSLGFAVLFLVRVLGGLYFINNIKDSSLNISFRKQLRYDFIFFLLFFLLFIIYVMTKSGFAISVETGLVYLQPFKYYINMITLPFVLSIFLIGVILVVYGSGRGLFSKSATDGIWFAGSGTVLTVFALLLCVGYNNTSYYPSIAELSSSLTIFNSSSSEFTLRVMSYVSLFIPVVLIYVFYTWKKMNKKKISSEELENTEHKY